MNRVLHRGHGDRLWYSVRAFFPRLRDVLLPPLLPRLPLLPLLPLLPPLIRNKTYEERVMVPWKLVCYTRPQDGLNRDLICQGFIDYEGFCYYWFILPRPSSA